MNVCGTVLMNVHRYVYVNLRILFLCVEFMCVCVNVCQGL